MSAAAHSAAALVPADEVGAEDLRACEAMLRAGLKSFDAASKVLPSRIRRPAAALYAFCRVADDLVDEGGRRSHLLALRERLDRIYAGRPVDHPADRAFAVVVRRFGIPRGVPDLLLEGFAWDLDGRRYETLSDTVSYGVRVASTVGVMMTLIMGRRDPRVLARAADLGAAMQLTNIARDVGEDARMGRLYLPAEWLRAEGTDPDAWLAAPRFTPAIGAATEALLDEADVLYARALDGIAHLPWDVRASMCGAARIYRDIGRVIRRNGCDSVSTRAHTGVLRKAALLLRSLAATLWRPRPLDARALPEAAPLIDAVDR